MLQLITRSCHCSLTKTSLFTGFLDCSHALHPGIHALLVRDVGPLGRDGAKRPSLWRYVAKVPRHMLMCAFVASFLRALAADVHWTEGCCADEGRVEGRVKRRLKMPRRCCLELRQGIKLRTIT